MYKLHKESSEFIFKHLLNKLLHSYVSNVKCVNSDDNMNDAVLKSLVLEAEWHVCATIELQEEAN